MLLSEKQDKMVRAVQEATKDLPNKDNEDEDVPIEVLVELTGFTANQKPRQVLEALAKKDLVQMSVEPDGDAVFYMLTERGARWITEKDDYDKRVEGIDDPDPFVFAEKPVQNHQRSAATGTTPKKAPTEPTKAPETGWAEQNRSERAQNERNEVKCSLCGERVGRKRTVVLPDGSVALKTAAKKRDKAQEAVA